MKREEDSPDDSSLIIAVMPFNRFTHLAMFLGVRSTQPCSASSDFSTGPRRMRLPSASKMGRPMEIICWRSFESLKTSDSSFADICSGLSFSAWLILLP